MNDDPTVDLDEPIDPSVDAQLRRAFTTLRRQTSASVDEVAALDLVTRRRRPRHTRLVVLSGLAAGAACAIGALVVLGGDDRTPVEVVPPATTPDGSGDTPATTVTGDVPIGTRIPFDDLLDVYTDTGAAVVPQGSGCAPGAGALPDGRWFGLLASVDETAGAIGFDLACLYLGEAAVAKGDEHGAPVSPEIDPMYIENESTTVRTVPVTDDTEILTIPDPVADFAYQRVTLDGLSRSVSYTDERLLRVWLVVEDGELVRIQADSTNYAG
jgi:hypothetical protein